MRVVSRQLLCDYKSDTRVKLRKLRTKKRWTKAESLSRKRLFVVRKSPGPKKLMYFSVRDFLRVFLLYLLFGFTAGAYKFPAYVADYPYLVLLLLAAFMLLTIIILEPKWSIPALKKLSNAFESKHLNSLARKADKNLPSILSKLILVEKNGETHFRLWIVSFACQTRHLVKVVEHLLSEDDLVTRIPAHTQRPYTTEIKRRRLVKGINLSMPHSTKRQFFPLLPRGTHSLGVGTL